MEQGNPCKPCEHVVCVCVSLRCLIESAWDSSSLRDHIYIYISMMGHREKVRVCIPEPTKLQSKSCLHRISDQAILMHFIFHICLLKPLPSMRIQNRLASNPPIYIY